MQQHSDNQLGAHEFVKLDLGASNLILHRLLLRVVRVHQSSSFSFIIGEEVCLFLFERLDSFPKLIVLLLEGLDFIVHVSL